MKQRLLLSVLLMLLCSILDVAYAVPSRRRPVQRTLPDGSRLTIVVNGDEHRNWVTTHDGYTIRQKADGFFYYLEPSADTLRCTEIRANEPVRRTVAERSFLQKMEKRLLSAVKSTFSVLTPKSSSPVVDPGKAGWLLADNPYRGKSSLEYIVVPVSYPDKPLKYTQADLERLCNTSGLNEWGLVGSVRDFFEDMSFGKFSARARVLPVYQTQNKYGTYGKSGGMDTEIVAYLESQGIYWPELSKHGAPIIAVVFPGFSQSDTGDEKDIWANQHSIGSEIKTVYANYATILYTPEFDNYPEELPGTYTFCHEFSHALGIPDLYDTNYETDGQHFDHFGWDVMVGSLGRNAPSHNSFIRYKLGWMKNAIELNKPTRVSLQSVDKEQCGYFFRATTEGEFFWLENRQPGKWDVELPNYGMLIYHVDSLTWYDNCKGEYKNGMVIGWSGRNQVNGSAARPGFDLEEADGIQSWDTQAGDCFPGSAGITSFTDATKPGARDYAGNATGKPLTNITLQNGVVAFDFMGGGAPIAEVLTADVKLTSANSMNVQLNIKRGSGVNITECGVYYGLTAALQSNKVTGVLSGNRGEVNLKDLRNNMNYYLRSYIVVDGVTIKDAVCTLRTSLAEISALPATYDFTDPATINTIIPQANVEGYLPSMEESRGGSVLTLPLSSRVVFPMLHVQAGKELYIRFQHSKKVIDKSFKPYLYYRYGYQEEWRSLKDALALVRVIPEQNQIQFAIGAEQENSYYFGSSINYNFLPYYERKGEYTPIVTFTDKPEGDWVIHRFPFTPSFATEDFSLWGAFPDGSESTPSVDEFCSEDYTMMCKERGYFKSDMTLPVMNTSVLNKPVLRFVYAGGMGTGLFIDYRDGESKEWTRLDTDYLLKAVSSTYNREYVVELPKSPRIQLRIKNMVPVSHDYSLGYDYAGTATIHHLRIGEGEDLSVATAGVTDEQPVVKVELNCNPDAYKEYGVVVDNSRYIACKDARYSVSYMRIPGLPDRATATVKAYARTKDGRTLYSPAAVTVTQPVRTTVAQTPTSTFVDNRGRYSVLRSMYYPGGKEILIQGLCWSLTRNGNTPTVEKNDGLFIVEDSRTERTDSIVPARSGSEYYVRAFRMCEGESTYTYGRVVKIRSGATGQQELTLPFSFADCSQEDLEAYWKMSGRWTMYNSSLTASVVNHVSDKTFRIVTPLIRKKLADRHALKLFERRKKSLRVYLIDEKTQTEYEAKCCIAGDFSRNYEIEGRYKIPAGLEEFRIAFEFDNVVGNECELVRFTIEEDNGWYMQAEEAAQDARGNYLIATPGNLAWVAVQTYMIQDWSKGKSFIQTANLDLTGRNWFPIGMWKYYFYGSYDGQGHTIEGLTINAPTESYQGLFGYLGQTEIRGVHVKSGSVTGADYVGALAGISNAVIEDCTNAAQVKGNSYVGGIAGQIKKKVMACINYGTVSGGETGNTIGGITGNESGELTACANLGEVSGYEYVGGLCGTGGYYLRGAYNAGRVTGVTGIGAISGSNSGYYNASLYYDRDISSDGGYLTGFSDSDGVAQVVTTQQLKSQEVIDAMNRAILVYTNLYSWKADPAGGYPVLNGGSLVSIGSVTKDAEADLLVVSASGRLHLTVFKEGEIRVYSSDGQLMKSLRAEVGTYELPLAPGIYLVRLGGQTVKACVF